MCQRTVYSLQLIIWKMWKSFREKAHITKTHCTGNFYLHTFPLSPYSISFFLPKQMLNYYLHLGKLSYFCHNLISLFMPLSSIFYFREEGWWELSVRAFEDIYVLFKTNKYFMWVVCLKTIGWLHRIPRYRSFNEMISKRLFGSLW